MGKYKYRKYRIGVWGPGPFDCRVLKPIKGKSIAIYEGTLRQCIEMIEELTSVR